MITREALQEAIAEVTGKRNPNRDDCMMLAAFYTIQDRLYPEQPEQVPVYSTAPPSEQAETQIDLDSGSEFSETVRDLEPAHVWAVMDELMETLRATNPRLYNGVMRELAE